MDQSCFHLSIPAIDLALSRHWYEQVLGCRAGRCSDEALILDLAATNWCCSAASWGHHNRDLPAPFRADLSRGTPWHALDAGWNKPASLYELVRFAGEVLEHQTFFLQDPSNNWLEFKHYRHSEAVLGCQEQRVVGDRDLR